MTQTVEEQTLPTNQHKNGSALVAKKKKHDLLNKAIVFLLTDIRTFNYRFFGEFGQYIDYQESDKVPTAGVIYSKGRLIMLWNRKFLDSLTEKQALFLYLHEISHLLGNWHKRVEYNGLQHNYANIAHDMVINSNILEDDGLKEFVEMIQGGYVVPKKYNGERIMEPIYDFILDHDKKVDEQRKKENKCSTCGKPKPDQNGQQDNKDQQQGKQGEQKQDQNGQGGQDEQDQNGQGGQDEQDQNGQGGQDEQDQNGQGGQDEQDQNGQGGQDEQDQNGQGGQDEQDQNGQGGQDEQDQNGQGGQDEQDQNGQGGQGGQDEQDQNGQGGQEQHDCNSDQQGNQTCPDCGQEQDGQGEQGQGQGEQGQGQGEQGQGQGGNPLTGQDAPPMDENGGVGDMPEDRKYNEYGENGQTLDVHFDPKSPIEKELLEQVAKDISDKLKNRGLMSSQVEKMLEGLERKPNNWLSQLKRWIVGAKGLGSYSKTFKKPNRYNIEGFRGKRKNAIVFDVILDTSGSMVNDIPKVLGTILRDGIQCNIIQIDTQVQSDTMIENQRDIKKLNLKGFGGTILQPAIDYIVEKKQAPRPCVIMTDGYTDDLDIRGIKDKVIVLTTGVEPTMIGNNYKMIDCSDY